MNPVNPDDFVITRRRKKYRFAKFSLAANCFELAQWQLLTSSLPLTLEVGAGSGLFSVELAARHPERMFIALDVKADRLQKGAWQALERGLENIFFVRAHVGQLLEVCHQQSVDQLWITFPDPYPRTRSAKHRLLHPEFLQHYRKILSPKGALHYKTDNHALFDWSLEQLVATQWQLRELTYDLHGSALPTDYKIMTTFEKRYIGAGLPTLYLG